MKRAALLVLLAGCSASLGTTPAMKAALVVVDVATLVRRYVCARELDPLLGDPRSHYHAVDAGPAVSDAATAAEVSP